MARIGLPSIYPNVYFSDTTKLIEVKFNMDNLIANLIFCNPGRRFKKITVLLLFFLTASQSQSKITEWIAAMSRLLQCGQPQSETVLVRWLPSSQAEGTKSTSFLLFVTCVSNKMDIVPLVCEDGWLHDVHSCSKQCLHIKNKFL